MVKPHTPPSAAPRVSISSPIAAKLPTAAQAPAPRDVGGAIEPSMVLLPYLEVSRALLRAHHDALAMMEANRTLADALRAIVRRQQDLAFEIAEQAMARPSGEARAPDEDRATMFQQAAAAVRELGEAMITAQLSALDTLRDRALGGAAKTVDEQTATRH